MSTTTAKFTPHHSELGKKVIYSAVYDPTKLFPVLRQNKRDELGISNEQLPFFGFDVWNHYEVSWLNVKGKPIVALAEIIYPCDSPKIIESKSMKLYFNTFNNTVFESSEGLAQIIQCDIAEYIEAHVFVKLIPLCEVSQDFFTSGFKGICLDELDIACSTYTVDPNLLTVEKEQVTETLYSNLLKSNCLVTGQPDWGSVQIAYQGQKINHENLLKYIISFRDHVEFGEHCVERIFMDIKRLCHPQELTVYARYTRRGGLDINPYRTTHKIGYIDVNQRLCRQ